MKLANGYLDFDTDEKNIPTSVIDAIKIIDPTKFYVLINKDQICRIVSIHEGLDNKVSNIRFGIQLLDHDLKQWKEEAIEKVSFKELRIYDPNEYGENIDASTRFKVE